MSIREKLTHDLVTCAAGVAVWGGLYAGATLVVGWVAGLKPFEKAVTETLGSMSNTLVKISGDVEEIKKAKKAATDDVAAGQSRKGGKWFNLF